jgi:ferredoxin
MSKVSIDESSCVGCGLCESNCPEMFKVGDDGIAHVISQSCKTHNLKEIAEQCPVTAIKVE